MAYTAIDKSSLHFNTKIYTGNSGTNALTGIGFQPDMVWMKSTSATTDHVIQDAIRGVTKEIRPNKTDYEDTASNGITAFGTDGFTLGDWSVVNNNSASYASWSWKGGTTSVPSGGSITPTAVNYNATSGFGMYKYTGTGAAGTIAHGLGVAPQWIFVKQIAGTQAANFGVYHIANGIKRLELNTSNATSTDNGYWNSTAATSTLFSLGDDGTDTNGSSKTYIAYAFAPKTGFSKFGSYLGDGNQHGPFIYCGFKPAFVIVKKVTGTAANWVMTDNKFSYNGRGSHDSYVMFPSTTSAETDSYGLLLTSNGFTFKGSDSASATVNNQNSTYAYIAFAEAPLVGSNNIPATAK